MASAPLIVKISNANANGTEIRRFTSQSNSLTWSALSKKAAELFDLQAASTLKLSYVDDEGDRITLSSDDELKEAVGLALKASPAVLRLSILGGGGAAAAAPAAVVADTDAPMAEANTADAATATDGKGTAGGTAHKPTPNAKQAARSPSPSDVGRDVGTFIRTLTEQLPGLVDKLPPDVRRILPHAELDLPATIMANAASHAATFAGAASTEQADGAATQAKGDEKKKTAAGEGIHFGVTCDRSGICPIVGYRYNLVGHNYDLCHAEYVKLPAKERSLYQRIPPPFVHEMNAGCGGMAAAAAAAAARAEGATPPTTHPGVECDRSGMCPIVGNRYHLRGHNYDLCEKEFDKLPQTEKLLYTLIPPPTSAPPPHPSTHPWRQCGPWAAAAAAAGGAGGGGWRCGWGGGGGGGGGGFGGAGNGGNGFGGNGFGGNGFGGNGFGGKLAARFVRDVTIFDGTQMAPSTPFTKIWRIKNTGEVAWPPGTRMLFVGGDQMSSEMSVPLSRATAVQPGEEVDVAVEMVAPSDLGRYLGYWRLVGPHGRRKFGQRVWCHVQVVDPEEPPAVSEAELDSTAAEIVRKKSNLAEKDDDDEAMDDGEAWEPQEPQSDATATANGEATATARPAAAVDASTDDAAGHASDDDGMVLVTEAMANDGMVLGTEAAPAPAASSASPTSTNTPTNAPTNAPTDMPADMPAGAIDTTTPEGVKAGLASMGFTDASMVATAIEKNGVDIEACARDLAAANEWEALLDDLAEMGFENRELNMTLMLKHSGNVKRTVRELVEDSA